MKSLDKNFLIISAAILIVFLTFLVYIVFGTQLAGIIKYLKVGPRDPNPTPLVEYPNTATGIIQSSGLYDSDKYKFQMIDPLGRPSVNAYFLEDKLEDDLENYWGKCAEIKGEIDGEIPEQASEESDYNYGVFIVEDITIQELSNCNQPEYYNYAQEGIVQSFGNIEGILARSKRPAADISYDYKFIPTVPVEGFRTYADGRDEPENLLIVVPGNQQIYNQFEDNIGKTIEISGDAVYGYAESKVVVINSLKEATGASTEDKNKREFQIYFAKDFNRDSANYEDFQVQIEPVTRTTDRKDIATFLIEQLLIGPTEQEKARGLSTQLLLRVPPDIENVETVETTEEARSLFDIDVQESHIELNLKGYTTEHSSNFSDQHMRAQIYKTLTQLGNINEVKLTLMDNPCYMDRSGMPCREEGYLMEIE